MIYRLLADVVLFVHLAFILFVVAGGFFLPRWPRLPWLHLPAVFWGVAIELHGGLCPLTPLENRLRQLSGEAGYAGGFIEHYLVALIYPAGLTREWQIAIGLGVLAFNLSAYALWWHRRRQYGAKKQ